mmetsp:Transcript_19153/g.31523  ORF Transcript_19153/g.31523 Transcript_19153/m.31523 type:complete len:158 (+) Transcript_19153:747-1220(+)
MRERTLTSHSAAATSEKVPTGWHLIFVSFMPQRAFFPKFARVLREINTNSHFPSVVYVSTERTTFALAWMDLRLVKFAWENDRKEGQSIIHASVINDENIDDIPVDVKNTQSSGFLVLAASLTGSFCFGLRDCDGLMEVPVAMGFRIGLGSTLRTTE